MREYATKCVFCEPDVVRKDEPTRRKRSPGGSPKGPRRGDANRTQQGSKRDQKRGQKGSKGVPKWSKSKTEAIMVGDA